MSNERLSDEGCSTELSEIKDEPFICDFSSPKLETDIESSSHMIQIETVYSISSGNNSDANDSNDVKCLETMQTGEIQLQRCQCSNTDQYREGLGEHFPHSNLMHAKEEDLNDLKEHSGAQIHRQASQLLLVPTRTLDMAH